MDKRVLFIDLEDGHMFIDSTERYEYWRRREFKHGIYPSGLYTSRDMIKALQLTELIEPTLPWRNRPLGFDIKDESGNMFHQYTYDKCYKEATNGSFTLYFKRAKLEIIHTFDGPKTVSDVINKSISFLENDQSAGLRIIRATPTCLEFIKEDLRKMGVKLHCDPVKPEIKETYHIYKSLANSSFGMDRGSNTPNGGSYISYGNFTTIPRLSPEEIDKIFDSKNKETKTMEKKKMTVTDLFLKDIDSITITSTYSKLEHGCGKPYYIYYPEMEITEDIADTLLTVLLMAKRDFIRKVVFNPEKGTTAISKNWDGETVTVRCRDGEFDYILGYEMARSKRYIGADDYNWFNKIKNHRKTHIEYTEKPTEPKAKRTSKKGGKK